MMKTLVVGASGATGSQLVKLLLNKGVTVIALVRSLDSLSADLTSHPNLEVIQGSISEMSVAELAGITRGCNAVASCLGHNLSFKGMFGAPRQLVTDAVKNLSQAIDANEPKQPVKLVLMNTTGNRHRGLNEKISLAQHCVIGLLRALLPPHADNENAAEFLRREIGSENPYVKWCVVRPDSLTDDTETSEYSVHPSPIRSAIFDAGKTSRINVALFMTMLIIDVALWSKWNARMPVIYNEG